MLLFPGIAENSQDQEGHHFILRNSLEFSARFYFQKNPRNAKESLILMVDFPPPPYFASESVLHYKRPLRRCTRSRILSSANNKYRHCYLLINKVSKEDWFPMYFCVFWVWIHWCSRRFGSITPRTYKGGLGGGGGCHPPKSFFWVLSFSVPVYSSLTHILRHVLISDGQLLWLRDMTS